MKTTVKVKHLKQSSSKIRFVLKEINGMNVNKALDKLLYLNKKASIFIIKALKSAQTNLSLKGGNIDNEQLFITEAYVDQGPTMKRFRPAAMGRATPIRKRSSHLTITVSSKDKE